MSPEPLRVVLSDHDFHPVGEIGDPKFVTLIERYNKKSQGTVSIASDHRQLGNVIAAGARAKILDEGGQTLMSGWINDINGSGPGRTGLVEFTIEDDFVALEDILGWVIPGNPITGQGSAGQWWTQTGPAETVLKAAVTANATRLGYPLTCTPDLGRGSTVKARLRFDPLYEGLFPVVDGAGIDAAGIGVTIKQVDGVGLLLDVFEPAEYPRALTEEGGMIASWKWSRTTVTATRGVVGGQGEAQARVFRERVATDGREGTYGRIRERFRDARDTDDNTVLYERLDELLAEGKAKSGLSVEFVETDSFRYGTHVRVGDKVSLSVLDGLAPITDVLTEATHSWTADEGWRVVPKVGDKADDTTTMLTRAVARIARKIAHSQRS